MIITLTGSNEFALRQRLNSLIKAFVSEYGELALERIDAEEADAQVIIDTLQSLPFLSVKKMVVVRGTGANKAAAEKIEQIIAAAGDDVELIFHEPKIDRRTAFFKVLKTKTKLENFSELDGRALAKWLIEEAENQGGHLSHSDANYLIERLGSDQFLLFNELTKLVIYDPKITRKNIELLTEPTYQSKIFDLLDAAFSGDKEKALKLYEDQRAQKVEPPAIAAMLAWQLQLLTIVKYGDGRTAEQIAKDLNMSSYPISKASRLAAKLNQAKLKELINEAFDIDLKSKTGSIDLDEALKTYIVTI